MLRGEVRYVVTAAVAAALALALLLILHRRSYGAGLDPRRYRIDHDARVIYGADADAVNAL